ncbi:MAG: cupin domain-containing protein [Deltaproteobacteria bacterium]|nr:cupin domain-containing protein [Deltaproteobacteria bacterium]
MAAVSVKKAFRPLDEQVIARSALRVSTGMTINGVWRNAGAVYTFSGHPGGSEILCDGKEADWALSWTTLPDGKDLEPHYHPFESHVAIVQGRAVLTGERHATFRTIEAGGLVRIPPWCLHGFRCENSKPFWALSWQRANRSLFFAGDRGEAADVVFPGDPSAPAVPDFTLEAFVQNGRTPASEPVSSLDQRPKFQFFDFTNKNDVVVEIEGPAFIFATSGGVHLELPEGMVELREGDALPVEASRTVKVVRKSPLSAIATLQFC